MDCKILTKILALRLERALPNIIHKDQVGFMKNLSSADHMRRLLLLIWTNHSNRDPILAISLDAQMAFDRVEWEFVFSTLIQFGFGPSFIISIKILYKNPRAALMTNRIISSFFDLTRGTRQGCSLSSLLFNVVLQPLAIAIRSDANIRGVEGGRKEHKLLLYVDEILMLTLWNLYHI